MDKIKPLKIMVVASEVAPYAKSGGLGDVTGSLPLALKEQGVDIRVVLPKYKTIKADYFADIDFLGAFNVSLGWRNQLCGVLEKNKENDGVTTYFLENDYYFGRDGLYGYGDDDERFSFFSKAALELCQFIDFYPDIIHCNDWQTGIIPMLLNENYKKFSAYKNIKTLYTIHNLQYQGNFHKNTMDMFDVSWNFFSNCEYDGQVNFMKTGIIYSDMVSTVSKTYAEEIKTFQYGYGLDGVLRENAYKLCGILNGIDYKVNNPESDERIFTNYGINSIEKKKDNKYQLQNFLCLPQRDVPVISIISRLADQKGLDLVTSIVQRLLSYDIQFILLGTGERRLEDFFKSLEYNNNEKVRSCIMFDDTLAQRIYAASDMFLMPSLFEPCGLGQMFSLRYGTIPIVRKTGGLSDTVYHYNEETGEGNGFVFEHYSSDGLMWAIDEALKVYGKGSTYWNKIVENALRSDNSWVNSAKEYIELYEKIESL